MKLNEKGFAFSTILYGSVALIAAVLYIILNTNKSSVDETYYYGEEVLRYLNDCITEEINLENCYSGTNPNSCNATAYHACLGVSDGNSQDKGVIISETLKGKISEAGNGLIEDPYQSKRYIYIGTSPKNYLEYSGKLWRIVSIETDGSLKLVDTEKYQNAAWDTNTNGVWGDNSTLYTSLNNNYLSTISDDSKLMRFNWTLGLLYPSLTNGTYNLENIITQENSGQTLSAKVGILSLSDYYNATENQTCIDDIFGYGSNNCNSWLIQYKGWTIDIDGENGSDSNGFAYYFGDGLVTNPSNGTQTTQYNRAFMEETNNKHDVYPVINLDRNSIIKGGDGTQGNPYVLK